MVGRLRPQSDQELSGVKAAGLDISRILATDEIVRADETFFAATVITDGRLLLGVRYRGTCAKSHSLVMRGKTRIRRLIRTQHLLRDRDRTWER